LATAVQVGIGKPPISTSGDVSIRIAPGVPGGMHRSLPMRALIANATTSFSSCSAATSALMPIAACIAGLFFGLAASMSSPITRAAWAAMPAIMKAAPPAQVLQWKVTSSLRAARAPPMNTFEEPVMIS
jgi:hypothetical protein